MAKFILGNFHRHKAFDNAVMSKVLWSLDLVFVGAILGVFRVLPVAWASGLGARTGRIFGRVFRNRNRHVRANLTMVLPDAPPEEIDRLAAGVWSNAGAVMAEFTKLHQIADPRGDFVEIEIMEEIATYRAPHPPAVFVAPHLGNWEINALAISRLGIPARALYAPLANPWLDRMLLDFRAPLGCELISREAGLRAFMEALKAGTSPIMVNDRRIEGGKPLPFFGADRETSILPARLALRFGVPLVLLETERLPGPRFRVCFHPPLHPRNPTAYVDAQTLDLSLQINEKFEHWIRARPDQWLCTSKIWSSSVLRDKTDIYKDA